jgi:hypothetical protein
MGKTPGWFDRTVVYDSKSTTAVRFNCGGSSTLNN